MLANRKALVRSSRCILVAAAGAGLAAFSVLIGASSAQASALATSFCDNSALTQPFTPWADSDLYKLAPGGDFESGAAGWTLNGGAQVVPGSEFFAVSGTLGSSSMQLPVGASALSPATCVNAAYPSFRFFDLGPAGSGVNVSVVYTDPAGNVDVVPVGGVAGSAAWQPTAPMLTGSAIAGAGSGGTAMVQLLFSAAGGTSQIDDVYVDPWSGH